MYDDVDVDDAVYDDVDDVNGDDDDNDMFDIMLVIYILCRCIEIYLASCPYGFES